MTFPKYIILLNIGLVYFSQTLLANEPSLSNQTTAEYFTKAADQGNANAQFHLGMLYFYGDGVIINYTKSAEYLTKAANQGNSNAQLQMGMLYSDGKGVPQDYTKAVEYFTKAANQGNIDAKQLKNIPKSTVKNNQETYELSCPNNSQHTSEDMADCVYTMTKQLGIVQHKYLMIIKFYIQRQYDDNPTLLKETLAAFEQENKDWEKLIKDASSATYSYNEGGSWRGIVANSRALELMEYRIHNQWQNWLICKDKVNEYDPPEPIFKTNN